MHVSVRGANSRKWSYYLKKAAFYFAYELMHTNLIKHLSITIDLVTRDKNFTDNGQCEWDDLDPPPNPRTFIITLAKGLPKVDTFQSLAHEMVHVKQYAKNEMTGLYHRDSNLHTWKGGNFSFYNKLKPTKVGNSVQLSSKGDDYYYQPWEIEAYGLEVGLWNRFKVDVYNDIKNLPRLK